MRATRAILAAAFLFNLGQGVLRPAMPLYLQRSFAASYTMVTSIPVVFGVGKWVASLPSGHLMDRVGRRALMVSGLVLIAAVDLLSVATPDYRVFLALRGVGGAGWAMFATVATTITVGAHGAGGRGRAVSALLTSETLGLLAGSAAGGWLYQDVGAGTPFVLEAGCLLAASLVLLRARALEGAREPAVAGAPERHALGAVLRIPGVVLMGATSAVLMAVQTGVMVFLFPLYLVSHGGLGPGMVGVLVSLTVLGRLGALWLGGGASDRWGRMRVLWPALVAYAVVLAGLTLATHPVALGVAGVAAGGAAGLAMPLPAADIGDRVPPHLRAVAIGWLRTMTDTGHILGPLAMGWVADTAGAGGPFVLAAGALLVVGWRCRRRQGAGAA